jgi:hypothetical protein
MAIADPSGRKRNPAGSVAAIAVAVMSGSR